MTAARPKRTAYDNAVDVEISRWPGVRASRMCRGKHYAIVLGFNGVSRFVCYAATPSDRRGVLNHIGDIRRTLRAMGARRR